MTKSRSILTAHIAQLHIKQTSIFGLLKLANIKLLRTWHLKSVISMRAQKHFGELRLLVTLCFIYDRQRESASSSFLLQPAFC